MCTIKVDIMNHDEVCMLTFHEKNLSNTFTYCRLVSKSILVPKIYEKNLCQ